MNIDRIFVRSRIDAVLFDPDFPYLIISVSDPFPKGAPVEFLEREGRLDIDLDILRLTFDDIDPRRLGHANEVDSSQCIPMNASQANEILPFLRERLREGVSAVLVHCNAGIIRSPSIAFAICDAFGLPREIVDWERAPRRINEAAPNKHVYSLTLAALLKNH